MMNEAIKAPFPYFGGKSRVAPVVWQAFGSDVNNYVEPFAGSLAVLLARPHGPGKLETVNDRSCMIVNFWRAIQHDPYAVAAHCDWPVSEADQTARHRWLVEHLQNGARFRENMLSDPDAYDAKIAGWWVWGAASWIGSGWCPEPGTAPDKTHPKIPDLYGRGNGRGIRCALPERESAKAYLSGNSGVQKIQNQMPSLGNPGRGIGRYRIPAGHTETVNALAEMGDERAPPCFGWFAALADRLRRTRIVCGDWQRVLTPTVLGTTTTRNSGMVPCAVFLDPPYSDAVRVSNLYSVDDGSIASKVVDWAVAHGDDPDLRIAVCGYASEGHRFPSGWTEHECKAGRGYGSKIRDQERIWFSPHCLPVGAKKTGLESLYEGL
jgi:hypothetical protein